jgi:hypothetical protein
MCAVFLQDDFKRQLAQLHSDVEVAVLQATAPLQKQLKGKADVSQLASSASSLEARLSSSEKSLLLGLKSVGDKAALLLQHKADLAAFEDWKQHVGEELAAVQAQLVAQQASVAAAGVSHHSVQRQLCSSSSSAGVAPGSQSSSSACQKRQSQCEKTARPLEAFAALMGGQVHGSAGADTGNAAAAGQQPDVAVDGTVYTSGAVGSSCALVPGLPGSGHGTVAAAAAAAAVAFSGCNLAGSVAAAGAALQHADTQAASGSAAAAAAASSVASTSTVTATNGSAASGVAATIVRPLTTSKPRNVSPARTQTPGSPKTAASSKQRPPSMQPWPTGGSASPAAAAASELHSAAHNAKLAKAARDKEHARARLGDSKALVAALMHSSVVPAAEDVADALQQQLNVLGLTSPRATARDRTACGVQADEGLQKQGTAADGALAAARVTGTATAAPRTSGTLDGSGRLVGTTIAAAGLHLPVAGPDRGEFGHQAGCEQLGGALLASGVTYSLRLQSAGAQQHSKAAAVAGVARTSSVGALPVCLGSVSQAGGSSSAGGGSDGQTLSQQRPAPTAEGLRALLKGSSANSSSNSRGGSAAAGASGQLPPAAGRIGSGGSRGSGSAHGEVKV